MHSLTWYKYIRRTYFGLPHLPDMHVNEILHRIKDQLPGTNYKHGAVKKLIKRIDGIDLSKRAITSRTSTIIRAYHKLRYRGYRLALRYIN
jgi:hypothetical protein